MVMPAPKNDHARSLAKAIAEVIISDPALCREIERGAEVAWREEFNRARKVALEKERMRNKKGGE